MVGDNESLMVEIDRDEIAFKVTTNVKPPSARPDPRVSVKFILEHYGLWVIDPRDKNLSRSSKLAFFQHTSRTISFDPNNGRWLAEARSSLQELRLKPIFYDTVLAELRAKISIISSGSGCASAVEFKMLIKSYRLAQFVEEDVKLAMREYDTWFESRTARSDEDQGWVVVSDKSFASWYRALCALEGASCDADQECPICLRSMCSDTCSVVRCPCHHVFHQDCISEWFKTRQSCPLCRRDCAIIRNRLPVCITI